MASMSRSVVVIVAVVMLPNPITAQGVVMQKNVSLAMAKAIAEGTIAACKAKGFNTSAAVVDRAGHVMVILRDEQATAQTVEMRPPSAPMNLTAAMVAKNKARLSWTDSSSNETGFVLQRSSNGGLTWSTVATLAANTSSYTDSGLRRGTTYQYRVVAHNGSGTSAYSAPASARAGDTLDNQMVESGGAWARGRSSEAHERHGLF